MTVKGKDCVFFIDDAGTLKPVCCARTATLSTTADIGETSTLSSGKWKTFKGLKLSFTLSAGGLVSFDMNIALAVLRNKLISLLPLSFRFAGVDANHNEEIYSGSILITNIDSPFTYNANYEYTMTAQGTGELAVTVTTDATDDSIVYWGWSATPFTTANIESFVFQKSRLFPPGMPIELNYTESPAGYYLAVKLWRVRPPLTHWHNTDFNFGLIPDQVFNPLYLSASYQYAFTRVKPVLSSANKIIIYS